jgi:hypothetical protein
VNITRNGFIGFGFVRVAVGVLLTGVLVLTSLVALVGCSSGEQTNEVTEESIVGSWKLQSASVDGVEVGFDLLGAYGYAFVFEADGTATVTLSGTPYASTYHLDEGVVSFDNVALVSLRLAVAGTTLIFEDSATGTTLVFVHED